ncbi:hypothetical protein GCM10009625_39540 [Brachybacterium fresconis]
MAVHMGRPDFIDPSGEIRIADPESVRAHAPQTPKVCSTTTLRHVLGPKCHIDHPV